MRLCCSNKMALQKAFKRYHTYGIGVYLYYCECGHIRGFDIEDDIHDWQHYNFRCHFCQSYSSYSKREFFPSEQEGFMFEINNKWYNYIELLDRINKIKVKDKILEAAIFYNREFVCITKLNRDIQYNLEGHLDGICGMLPK